MSVLRAREGYGLWAPRYAAETAVSFLEDCVVADLGVPTEGRRLLDVGCGTARRLRDTGAALAVGVDLTPEMLAHAAEPRSGGGWLAAADASALPFAAATFDVAWCRLVLGHLSELGPAYAELGRVCRARGMVVITDFHPAAASAGHRRTFRDDTGVLRELEHHAHTPAGHLAAARAAGLEQTAQSEGVVGPRVRRFYAEAQRLDAYEAQRGLPLVLALAFEKVS